MFSNAYKQNSAFTKPLIIANRFNDGTVDSGLGTFIVVNSDGWLMTAAHNLSSYFVFQQHQKEVAEYNMKVQEIERNPATNPYKKQKAIRSLKKNDKWITAFSLIFGSTDVIVEKYEIHGEHDIAFIKVDPKHFTDIKTFPSFKNPNNYSIGSSLCKLGYPFTEIQASYDIASNSFVFPEANMTIPLFPIDGIFTRTALFPKSQYDGLDVKFLETSTPGLRGQSGGPIFDTDGNIWAIQSQTHTIPLGFTGKLKQAGKVIEENQFINVGLGVHGETIVTLMKKHNINFNLVD